MHKPRNILKIQPPSPQPSPWNGRGGSCKTTLTSSSSPIPGRGCPTGQVRGSGWFARATFALFLLANAPLALAQTASDSGLGAAPPPVQYIVSPETPGAGDTVYIQVNGVGSFIGESPIAWTQNGQVIAQGVGKRNVSFTVGGYGSQTVIGVTIRTTQHGTIAKQWTFTPSLVNLVWEAHTTVPPFYDGKALASPGSSVTVTAFPVVVARGVRQSPANLSYQWRLNNQPQADQSGLGFSSFTFPTTQIHSQEEVTVTVLLNDGNTKVAYSNISVPIIEPSIVLYQHDPLRGVLYGAALGTGGSFTMPGTEMTVRAEPFFFSVDSAARGNLKYAWQLNGNDTTGPSSAQGELTLRQTGTGRGTADLSVSLQNTDPSKILQGAQSTPKILFGNTTRSTGLFGL